MNSIRNKFDHLIAITKGDADVLMISDTKLDEPFPYMQFNIDGYNTFSWDQNANSGGILVYVRDDIPCKLIPIHCSTIEGFFIDMKLRKKKLLWCCSKNPHRRFVYYLIDIGKNLDLLSTNYDNILLLGDFKAEVENNFVKDFCNIYGMKSFIRVVPTCYKNLANATFIDLFLASCNRSFQVSNTIETGLSDFYKMMVTLLKIYFQKREAKVVNY